MAKSYWNTKAGRQAAGAAAAADYAGAMKVSPGFRAGRSPVAPSTPAMGTLTMGKQIAQGPTTGFGSFRGPSDYDPTMLGQFSPTRKVDGFDPSMG
jgi:hypothetical protein